MPGHIADAATLLQQAPDVPLTREVERALAALSFSPVARYAPFTDGGGTARGGAVLENAMRARLIMDPADVDRPAFVPVHAPLLLEEDGRLLAYTPDYALLVPGSSLEEACPEQVGAVLHKPAWRPPILSPPRELPDVRLISTEFLRWVAAWWREEAAAVREARRSADAVPAARR